MKMKKIQYNYLPADGAAGNFRETQKSNHTGTAKTPTPPDEATVARLNALAREYPFCAWGKATNNTLL
jgi:hypothetical protein